MKKTTSLFALLTALAIFVNGCIIINVEKKENSDKNEADSTEEITVESN